MQIDRPPVPSVPVAIALGSNLGDRRAHLEWAIAALRDHLFDLRVSAFHDTEPEGVPEPQPRYLNAVVVGRTTRAPRALLSALLGLERARGRERRSLRASRPLDLDLILFGDSIINEAGLIVPHPAFTERRFVLEPLAEVASEWRDPRSGKTIQEILQGLTARP